MSNSTLDHGVPIRNNGNTAQYNLAYIWIHRTTVLRPTFYAMATV